MLAGFSASHATPTIAVDPTAAMVTIAPRRKRVTRPGAARSTRVSGSALGGAGFGDAFWTGCLHARGWWLSSLAGRRSEEHTSELQSLMRISYAVFCLIKTKRQVTQNI